MGPDRIRRLDETTIQQIAAGEVVERPASVVKELIENAVDAGATEIRVRFEGGGIDLLSVEDDGRGIVPDQLVLAVERHATSKLTTAEEIAQVATLGFRGEALAAIGAVSRLRLLSRAEGQDSAHGISVIAGQVVGEFEDGRAPGTTVEVRDLFFNTPARRKFLKSPAAEQVELIDTIERLYLARPSIGLLLRTSEGEVDRLPPVGRLRDAVARVLGPEFLRDCFEVHAGGREEVRVDAVLGRPTVTRSNSAGLYVALDGRVIQSRAIVQAVRLAFAEHLPRTRFPVGVVQVQVGPGRVDVNVHPTKREVRFLREREVADFVRHAVRAALLDEPALAEAPVGASAGPAPDAFAAVPVLHLDASSALAPSTGPVAVQRTLGPRPAGPAVAAQGRHPPLQLIGPIFDLYWLAESQGTLVLLDQHAASERVVFESLRASGSIGRQELLVPVRLELSARRFGLLDELAATLRAGGYDWEFFGSHSIRVTGVPSYRGRRASAEGLVAVLDELAGGGRPTVPDGMTERRNASLACHAAIRGGDVVSGSEMEQVLHDLYALPGAAYACPHGRPILVQIPRASVDRWFLRSPG
jgi:DNA mismatch repair protein MutL